jgi:Flp pilus assembly pilin Flp
MFAIAVAIQLSLLDVGDGLVRRLRDERGQTSAEYALVLFGAAAVALLIAVWARGTDRIGKLLDTVFDSVIRTIRAG